MRCLGLKDAPTCYDMIDALLRSLRKTTVEGG